MTETTDLPECSCPHMADLTRMGLEGRTVPTCDVHRPALEPSAAAAPALNSDALIAGLGDYSATL